MVGNDIVDLGDVDANVSTYSSRWMERVFTRHERLAIDAAPDSQRMQWRTWAAKEAAYKWAAQWAAQKSAQKDAKTSARTSARTVFSPHTFEVKFERAAAPTSPDQRHGRVEWQDEQIPFFVDEDSEWLHVWVDDGGERMGAARRGVEALSAAAVVGDGPSDSVRQSVILDACGVLPRFASDLAVIRVGRIPHLEANGQRLSSSLSLSHHGRFVAFVWRVADGAFTRADPTRSPNDRMNGVSA